jgi:hypothetical protein
MEDTYGTAGNPQLKQAETPVDVALGFWIQLLEESECCCCG